MSESTAAVCVYTLVSESSVSRIECRGDAIFTASREEIHTKRNVLLECRFVLVLCFVSAKPLFVCRPPLLCVHAKGRNEDAKSLLVCVLVSVCVFVLKHHHHPPRVPVIRPSFPGKTRFVCVASSAPFPQQPPYTTWLSRKVHQSNCVVFNSLFLLLFFWYPSSTPPQLAPTARLHSILHTGKGRAKLSPITIINQTG